MMNEWNTYLGGHGSQVLYNVIFTRKNNMGAVYPDAPPII